MIKVHRSIFRGWPFRKPLCFDSRANGVSLIFQRGYTVGIPPNGSARCERLMRTPRGRWFTVLLVNGAEKRLRPILLSWSARRWLYRNGAPRELIEKHFPGSTNPA